MKINIDVECEKCQNGQRVIYSDPAAESDVVLPFVIPHLVGAGWILGKEVLCPVCSGEMELCEFERRYCQPNQKMQVEVTTNKPEQGAEKAS